MGRNPSYLNEKQTAVLEWVKAGCPDDVYATGYEHRITARALADRGLIDIVGRGPTWQATITPSGKAWKSHTVHEPSMSEADDLIQRVLNSGGQVTLPEGPGFRESYQTLVNQSLKSPLRPRGKKLELKSTGSWGSGPALVVFAEHFDDLVEPMAVRVPTQIAKYHPAVKAYTQDRNWQFVTAEHVARAARILQSIANEAEHRGLTVLTHAEASNKHKRTDSRAGLPEAVFFLDVKNRLYGVKIKEIAGAGAPKKEPRPWNARPKGPLWLERRGWEFISTGRLELSIDGPGSPYSGGGYRDTRAVKVEEQLPELFRAIEIYALRLDWQEAERQRELNRRRERWEAAVAHAKEQYEVEARYGRFREVSDAWDTIKRRRAFLSAAREQLQTYEGDDHRLVQEHLDFAERQIAKRDPLQNLSLVVIDVPEPTPDQLKPFLGGWNPYGPEMR